MSPLFRLLTHFNPNDQRVTIDGGEGGIRTPGTRKRTIDFESTALDHSATSPEQVGTLKKDLQLCKKILQKPIILVGPAIRTISANSRSRIAGIKTLLF